MTVTNKTPYCLCHSLMPETSQGVAARMEAKYKDTGSYPDGFTPGNRTNYGMLSLVEGETYHIKCGSCGQCEHGLDITFENGVLTPVGMSEPGPTCPHKVETDKDPKINPEWLSTEAVRARISEGTEDA